MDDHKPVTPAMRMFAGGLYFTVAVAMGFINKAALREFPHSNTLLLIQMTLTVAILRVGNTAGLFELKPLSMGKTQLMLPLALFYNANVAFALAGLQRMNIPMYQTLKRLTPCLICVYHGLGGKGWASKSVLISVGVIATGSLVAGIGDFNFDPKAYGFALTSCVLQAGYLLLAESGAEKGFTSTELLHYNSLLSIPVLIFVVYLTEADVSIPLLYSSMSVSLAMLVFGASFMGSILNYALFLCTSLNTALTTTIIGVMKAVAMTSLGFFLLGGAPVTPLNFSGIVINTMGGVLYSHAKYAQRLPKQKDPEPHPHVGIPEEEAKIDVKVNYRP
eukprot:TRINITY_DN26959_c0_g1_i1.p1 TRINITY_DN26959_c0_g1~~TRINITY_DN26959_c0_g1_i1.p1  ORF type:complete len:333 (+),score=35.21 TRINITY_DN26959_c0_g1_i1:81-1079(+)